MSGLMQDAKDVAQSFGQNNQGQNQNQGGNMGPSQQQSSGGGGFDGAVDNFANQKIDQEASSHGVPQSADNTINRVADTEINKNI